MDRARVEQAYAARTAPIPPELLDGYEAFVRARHLRFLWVVNMAAQLVFWSYGWADLLVLPDIGWLSIVVRSGFVSLTLPLQWLVLRRCRSMRRIDLLLPLLITLATALWFELLQRSSAPAVTTYCHASAIFVLLANLCVRVRFTPALLNSLLIVAITFTGVARLQGSWDTPGLRIFALAYGPVALFSLFISWWAAYYGRRAFLRHALEQDALAQLQQANTRLQAQAMTDALTGVANRRQFDAIAEQAWERARRDGLHLCVTMIDVDHFKSYNDHHGHPSGDQALIAVAHELARQLRSHGPALVGRYGGEEFALMITLRPGEEALAAQLAHQLVQAVWQLGLPHGHRPDDETRVTISAGAALSSEPDIGTLADLMRCADSRLYAAKRAGRNTAVAG